MNEPLEQDCIERVVASINESHVMAYGGRMNAWQETMLRDSLASGENLPEGWWH